MTSPPRPALYWRLWRSVPRELGFLIFSLPIATTGFIFVTTVFWTGVGTVFAFLIGIIFVIAALYSSRGFGLFEIIRLEWGGRPRIERPEWQDGRARHGFFGWLRSIFANGHYWLYFLHTSVVNFVVSLVTWTLTVVWVSLSLVGVNAWWIEMIDRQDADRQFVAEWIFGGAGGDMPPSQWAVIDSILFTIIGLIFLATLPFLTRGLVLIHDAIARGMLGAFRSDALQRDLIQANLSRGAAAAAEGTSLRRLERDIHDGPQQRLVRMQMDLATADRRLDDDPAAARLLIGEAMAQSKEALEELRSLSRGFAPPILLDRGLVAALESAAVRSPISVWVDSSLPAGTPLPQEIERNAYFIASEALMNAIKHSGASQIVIRLSVTSAATGSWLTLVVEDDGHGGAAPAPGHGLAGLEERTRGVGGILELTSPVGGPTVISVRLPLG